jgi:hypothetical protein
MKRGWMPRVRDVHPLLLAGKEGEFLDTPVSCAAGAAVVYSFESCSWFAGRPVAVAPLRA